MTSRLAWTFGKFHRGRRHTVTLEKRLGRLSARQRLGIEEDHDAQIFGQGLNFFHIENATLSHSLIRGALMLTGLYWRGLSNSAKVELKHNRIVSAKLPASFDGFTILHISDVHVEMSEAAMERMVEFSRGVSYDICVLTGGYRAQTFGPFADAVAGVGRLCERLKGPLYGVLGNRDTICMVPAFERMGLRMLVNEQERSERGGAFMHLAGIDDALFYRMDNIEKAAHGIPHDAFSILLSHTPEFYRQAAHADFQRSALRAARCACPAVSPSRSTADSRITT
jgi:hypothetical protein